MPRPADFPHPPVRARPARIVRTCTCSAVTLLVLWMLGIVRAHTVGGSIHIVRVVAFVMVIVDLIAGCGRA